jgi:hypothetical protein
VYNPSVQYTVLIPASLTLFYTSATVGMAITVTCTFTVHSSSIPANYNGTPL